MTLFQKKVLAFSNMVVSTDCQGHLDHSKHAWKSFIRVSKFLTITTYREVRRAAQSSWNSSAVALTLTEISIRPHPVWNSPIWHWYRDSSGISIIRSTSGSHFVSASSSCSAIRSESLMLSKRHPLSYNFILGKRKKSQGACPSEQGRWGMIVVFVEAKNCCTTNDAWARALSLLWAHESWHHCLDGFPQSPQNVAVEFSIQSPSVLVEQIPYAHCTLPWM